MQDRPSYDELLSAIEHFLDTEIVPNVPGARGFHGRVAANAIRILRRELAMEDEQLEAEWAGLNGLLGAMPPPHGRASLRSAISERNEELCAAIRDGTADNAAIFAHVRRTVRDKLRVTNPELLARSEPPDTRP
jgi:hypothetical protein